MAFVYALLALLLGLLATTPVAQASGWEKPGVGAAVGRLVGYGVLGTVFLLAVTTPALFLARRITKGSLRREIAALMGAAIPVIVVFFYVVQSEQTWADKFRETVLIAIQRPEQFVSDWLPHVVAGGVLGFRSFSPATAAAKK